METTSDVHDGWNRTFVAVAVMNMVQESFSGGRIPVSKNIGFYIQSDKPEINKLRLRHVNQVRKFAHFFVFFVACLHGITPW